MRRLAGGFFAVLGAVLLLDGGFAAAAGPADPVSQQVEVDGSAPGAGLLVFGSRSRNESCSVTRNVRNLSGAEHDVRILDADGTVLDDRTLAAGAQVTFVVDHSLVTVPLLIQVGDGGPVELAQVGPFAPCDAPTGTVPPTTPPTTPSTTEVPTPSTPSTTPTPTSSSGTETPGPSPEEPTVTTPSVPTSAPPSVGTATVPVEGGPTGTTPAPPSTLTPVSVLGAQVTVPPANTTTRLPTTGADTRPTLVLGLSSIAVGAAFLLSSRATRASRRPSNAS